jgi:uncharacterized protein YkwD
MTRERLKIAGRGGKERIMANPTGRTIGRTAWVALAVATFFWAGPARAQVADPVAVANQVLALMNQERTKQGVPAFTRHCDLDAAAARHANDMVARNFFGHLGSDGTEFWHRMQQAGYKGQPLGENIAAGHSTPEGAVGGWMASTRGHREQILSPNAKEVGLAVAYGAQTQYRYYWVAVFAAGGGRPCSPTAATVVETSATQPSLQAQSATLEGSIRSIESERVTSIRFQNLATFPVQIYWLDYEGKRVLYGTLSPQQYYDQPTYVSHPWLVARSPDAAPMLIFEPTLQPSIAQINGTTTPTRFLPIQSPNLEGDARARDLGKATAIEFLNIGAEPVQIFWLDHSGKRVLYATLAKDQGYRQDTYLGHPWLLADHNGKALGIVEPTTSGGTARFGFDARP